jgi:uncharacterized protein YndB with AHSA1/START domain
VRLETEIVIDRQPEQVWQYLKTVSNISKWDRGVARTQMTQDNPEYGVGTEFDTYARKDGDDWGRMSYRVASVGTDSCTVQLTSSDGNAKFFKEAWWTFKTRPHRQGTLLTCIADFTLRLPYIFLAPILYMKKDATIGGDLESLKRAIESE